MKTPINQSPLYMLVILLEQPTLIQFSLSTHLAKGEHDLCKYLNSTCLPLPTLFWNSVTRQGQISIQYLVACSVLEQAISTILLTSNVDNLNLYILHITSTVHTNIYVAEVSSELLQFSVWSHLFYSSRWQNNAAMSLWLTLRFTTFYGGTFYGCFKPFIHYILDHK